jgi:hypothetical protein
VLHFGSVHYYAHVWLNGVDLGEHVGGHLQFEFEITAAVRLTQRNVLVVAVNNTLSPTTLPPGDLVSYDNNPKYPPGYVAQTIYFDFYNYGKKNRREREEEKEREKEKEREEEKERKKEEKERKEREREREREKKDSHPNTYFLLQLVVIVPFAFIQHLNNSTLPISL